MDELWWSLCFVCCFGLVFWTVWKNSQIFSLYIYLYLYKYNCLNPPTFDFWENGVADPVSLLAKCLPMENTAFLDWSISNEFNFFELTLDKKALFCFLINLWFVAPDLFDSVLKKIIGLDDYTKVIVDLMDLFHFTKLIVLWMYHSNPIVIPNKKNKSTSLFLSSIS